MDKTYSNRIQTAEAGGVRPLSTVLKTMELLDVLAQFSDETRLADIATAAGVSRSTAFQRLLTLIRAGWVEQTDDGRYRLTLKPVAIGGAALEQAHLGARTIKMLRDLVDIAGETASLAVLQDYRPYIIQRVEVDGLLRVSQPIGASFGLLHSASGRILYAYADDKLAADIRAHVAEVPDEAMCREVLADGYALSRAGQDVRAIAAPVFDHRDVCVSALSLVGPTNRFDADRLKGPLIETARLITALLKGKPPGAPHAAP